MKTLKFTFIMPLLSVLYLACSNKSYKTQAILSKAISSDYTHYTSLSITRVKKPWYAGRSLVIGKMKKSIPEYKSVKGLQEKWYSFTETSKYFGGIYFWQNKKDADNWFNQTWFKTTEKKYGEIGKVATYKIESIKSISGIDKLEGTFWAVLTYPESNSLFMEYNSKGLIKIVYLKDDKLRDCHLSLWVDKNDAFSFFMNKQHSSEYFYTPILIDNTIQ